MSDQGRHATSSGVISTTEVPSPTPPILPPLSPTQSRSSTTPPTAGSACGLASPPVSPTLSLFPHINTARPLSPPAPSAPAQALLNNHPTTSHSRRASLQSISKMPPIREDSNSIFADVAYGAHQRSRSGFYQYGEDYITAYDQVGLTPSPTPRSTSRTSVHSVRSLRSTRSARSGYSGLSSVRWSQSAPGPSHGIPQGNERNFEEMDRERDLEKGSVGDSEAEKDFGKGLVERTSWWRRWRRSMVVSLVIIVVIGIAVGLAFGMHSKG